MASKAKNVSWEESCFNCRSLDDSAMVVLWCPVVGCLVNPMKAPPCGGKQLDNLSKHVNKTCGGASK